MNRIIFKWFLLSIVLAKTSFVFGQETVNAILEGPQISINSTISAIDNKYSYILSNPLWENEFKNYKIDNTVILSVNHEYDNYIGSDYSFEVDVTIEVFDLTNVVISTINKTLQVEYDASNENYTDKSVYTFNDALKYKITISGIRDVKKQMSILKAPNFLRLESKIATKRYYFYDFNELIPTTEMGWEYNSESGELEAYWPYMEGAEAYDFEWIYVDDVNAKMSEAKLDYTFRNNATRVTVSNNYYHIPVIYTSGYILFRVRPVLINCSPEPIEVSGKWSSEDNYPVNFKVADYPLNCKYHIGILNEHNSKLNWQYVATFAEDGKHKDVVSYYDGILKNRQTVTKNNTDNKTIVGETLYDYQGRPAVQVLPTPTPHKKIEYFSLFNRAMDGANVVPYSRKFFDQNMSTGSCAMLLSPMVSTEIDNTSISTPQTGASYYYSSENADKEGVQAYVPDAAGYPFTQTEYEPDNTGRIRRQGGLGPDFQLGSGHETKYYYGQPLQEELDRIFGSEVGLAEHYKKNMVIDANGQTSISYLDLKGNVIATALAGDNPTKDINDNPVNILDPLASYTSGQSPINANLMNLNNTNYNSLEVNTQILVLADNTSYDFSYIVDGAFYDVECWKTEACYDCVYDLTISLIDECGNEMFTTPINQTIGDMPGVNNSGSKTCNTTTRHYATGSLVVELDAGNYTLTKRLSVNKDALNEYAKEYVEDNSCLKTYQEFLDATSDMFNASDCNLDCQSCKEDLGLLSDFITNGGTEAEWNELYEECDALCDQYESPCQVSYNMMLSDVSPGGQYALYDYSNWSSNDVLSVLNTSNKLPKKFSNPLWISWKYPVDENGNATHYLDAYGNESFVTDLETGSRIHPEDLSNVKDFILNWQPSWAKALVYYHPEYCYHTWCDEVKEFKDLGGVSSDDYDTLLYMTATYTLASTRGFIDGANPTGSSKYQIITNDPYFKAGGKGAGQINEMKSFMDVYYTNNSIPYSMYQLAAISARCGTVYGGAIDDNCKLFGTGGSDVIKDQEWGIFKAMYMAKKQYLQNKSITEQAITDGCYNGCIGTDHFKPSLNNYLKPPYTSNEGFLDSDQPCSINNFYYYYNKQKRYCGANDLSSINSDVYGDPETIAAEMQNKVDYNLYVQTGQCPLARDVQYLLNELGYLQLPILFLKLYLIKIYIMW